MKYKIKLIVGDWSHDGHEKTELFDIYSNLSTKEIEKAYNKAKKLLGFDFKDRVARKYQEPYILKSQFEKLKKYVSNLEDLNLEDRDNKFELDVEGYVDLYLAFIKAGNEKFEYKFIEDDSDELTIGGYGLFL